LADLDAQGRARFTKREKRIWDAAYAAAFVTEFNAHLVAGFETAVRTTTAERAAHIADQAVREFRRWRLQETSELGDSFWTVEPPWQPRGARG